MTKVAVIVGEPRDKIKYWVKEYEKYIPEFGKQAYRPNVDRYVFTQRHLELFLRVKNLRDKGEQLGIAIYRACKEYEEERTQSIDKTLDEMREKEELGG